MLCTPDLRRSTYVVAAEIVRTMLRTLLLVACFRSATQDWVEISQMHYKKPAHLSTNAEDRISYPAETTSEGIRTNFYSYHEDEAGRYRPNLKRPFVDEEFEKFPADRTAYPNRSITEHKWHQDEYRAGNIKRVNNGGKVKANITPEFSIEVVGEVTEQIPAFVTVTVTEHNRNDQQAVLATIEKVPNKGSVKRVQLANTPVKSPSIDKFNPVRRNDVYHGFTSMDSDEFDIKHDIFKETHSNEASTTNIRRVSSTTTEMPLWKYDRSTSAWPLSESTVTFQRQTIASKNKIPHNHTQIKANIIKINHYSTTTDNSITKENIMIKKNLETESSSDMSLKGKRLQNTKITDTNINKADDVTEKASIQSNFKNNANIKIKGHEMDHIKSLSTKLNDEKSGTDIKKITIEETKVNTMENVMKFLKVVTDTISKNTRRGVNGKVKYLNELKDTLLNSIKDRIDATWPDDGSLRGRRARSAEARGHVEFPSSESSLMTISFLTFAVFLIKLVLQVIQTYKHKTMMVAPVVVATAARKLRNT